MKIIAPFHTQEENICPVFAWSEAKKNNFKRYKNKELAKLQEENRGLVGVRS